MCGIAVDLLKQIDYRFNNGNEKASTMVREMVWTARAPELEFDVGFDISDKVGGLPHPTALPILGLEFPDFVSSSNGEIKEMVCGKFRASRVKRIMIELLARFCKSQDQGLQEKLSRLAFGCGKLQTPDLSMNNLTMLCNSMSAQLVMYEESIALQGEELQRQKRLAEDQQKACDEYRSQLSKAAAAAVAAQRDEKLRMQEEVDRQVAAEVSRHHAELGRAQAALKVEVESLRVENQLPSEKCKHLTIELAVPVPAARKWFNVRVRTSLSTRKQKSRAVVDFISATSSAIHKPNLADDIRVYHNDGWQVKPSGGKPDLRLEVLEQLKEWLGIKDEQVILSLGSKSARPENKFSRSD
jgi:hypothetical protein